VRRVLVDTGPLVAILSSEDLYHEVCVSTLKDLSGPLLSCWPVLTEVAWLLRRYPHVIQQLLKSLGNGFLHLLPLASEDAKRIGATMLKYENIRPQLADACLVYLAERERIETIFTLDQRDFSIYRRGRKRPFRIIPELE
jgi:uncharacterized protein